MENGKGKNPIFDQTWVGLQGVVFLAILFSISYQDEHSPPPWSRTEKKPQQK